MNLNWLAPLIAFGAHNGYWFLILPIILILADWLTGILAASQTKTFTITRIADYLGNDGKLYFMAFGGMIATMVLPNGQMPALTGAYSVASFGSLAIKTFASICSNLGEIFHVPSNEAQVLEQQAVQAVTPILNDLHLQPTQKQPVAPPTGNAPPVGWPPTPAVQVYPQANGQSSPWQGQLGAPVVQPAVPQAAMAPLQARPPLVLPTSM